MQSASHMINPASLMQQQQMPVGLAQTTVHLAQVPNTVGGSSSLFHPTLMKPLPGHLTQQQQQQQQQHIAAHQQHHLQQQQQQQQPQQQQQQASQMQQFLLASQFPISAASVLSAPATQLQSQPIVASPNTKTTQGGNTATAAGVAGISLAEMASIISPMTRRRANDFVKEEVKLMLHEIDKRKHILLSVSPNTSKLRRRAWDEVANSMAMRWPQETRRSGEQIKKKWENLVSKTKRKIRDGQMTPDLDWNETNTLVMQFLASSAMALRANRSSASSSLPYYDNLSLLNASAGSNSSTSPHGTYGANYFASQAVFPSSIDVSKFNGSTQATTMPPPTVSSSQGTSTGGPNQGEASGGADCKLEGAGDDSNSEDAAIAMNSEHGDSQDGDLSSRPSGTGGGQVPWASLGMSVDESVLNSLAPLSSGHPLLNLPSLTGAPSSSVQTELLEQARAEHRLRMQVLRLQRRAWRLHLVNIQSSNGTGAAVSIAAADSLSSSCARSSIVKDSATRNDHETWNGTGDGGSVNRNENAIGDMDEEDDEEEEEELLEDDDDE